jgi:hypothetical protein
VRYKNLAVGFAYDFGINKIKSYTGSTCEFLLSYTFGSRAASAPVEDLTAKTPQANDTLTDKMISKLKEETDSNKVQLERLKAELTKLKNGGAGAERSENLTENLMRTASSNDFVDENGMSLSAGFYVVIGSFSSKDNANKFKQANLIKGYNNTQVIQNHKTKVYYVYVTKTDTQEIGESEQKKYKNEYPDVWLQKLE